MASSRKKRSPTIKVDDEGEIVTLIPKKAVNKKSSMKIAEDFVPQNNEEDMFYINGVLFTQSTWEDDIKKTITKILTPFMVKRDLSKYLDKKAMKKWTKAFTHESFDYKDNYEIFEHYGDVVLKYLFTKYLLEIYPDLKVGQYSTLHSNYQARGHQGYMADKIGLFRLLRFSNSIVDINKVQGDIFESFFGALSTIGDDIIPGLGASVCYNAIVTLYENEDVSLDMAKKDPKTRFVQIFQRHGYTKDMEEISYVNGGGIKLSVLLSREANKFLKNNGIDMGSDGKIILAEGTGFSEPDIRQDTYNKALDVLEGFGVTPKWSERLKKNIDRSTVNEDLLEEAKKKALSRGFKDLVFTMDNKTSDKTSKVYEVKGVTKDGKEILLANYKARPRETDQEGRAGALKEYIKS